jgi:hypothetical protein
MPKDIVLGLVRAQHCIENIEEFVWLLIDAVGY